MNRFRIGRDGRRAVLALLLLWSAVPAANPGEFVVAIDTGQSKNTDRSLGAALFFSALVPGAGETYLRDPALARPFLLVEAGLWAGLWVVLAERDSYLNSARNYASRYGGISASEADEEFLKTMSRYRSYREVHHRGDSYEQAQILAGKRDRDYAIAPVPENFWDFGSPLVPENTARWETFRTTMNAYGWSSVALSWAVGGLVVARVASAVNVLHLYRVTAVKGLSKASPEGPEHGLTWTFLPDLGPGRGGMRVVAAF